MEEKTESRIKALSPLARSTLSMMMTKCSSQKYLYREFIEGCFDGIMRSKSYKGCENEKDEVVDITIILLNNLCKSEETRLKNL